MKFHLNNCTASLKCVYHTTWYEIYLQMVTESTHDIIENYDFLCSVDQYDENYQWAVSTTQLKIAESLHMHELIQINSRIEGKTKEKKNFIWSKWIRSDCSIREFEENLSFYYHVDCIVSKWLKPTKNSFYALRWSIWLLFYQSTCVLIVPRPRLGSVSISMIIMCSMGPKMCNF